MKFRSVLWLMVLLANFAFAACGGQENFEHVQMSEPPVQVPDTLEEQFDMLRPDNNGTVTSVAWSRYFPDSFPNDSFSFTTQNRFSISYSLRIAVVDPNHSLELVQGLPTERTDNIHINHSDSGVSIDVTLSVIHEDVGNIFQALFSMGVVESYFVEVWDVVGLSDEQKQFQWQTNSSIVVTLVEEG